MTRATSKQASPFDGEIPVEIPLPGAPLVRVLAQVRFQNMAVFKRDDFINPFIEALLDDYPLLEEGHETQIVVGPDGATQSSSANKIWKLKTLDVAWTVTVAPGSLAIETSSYSSRRDFLNRFRRVCGAFISSIGTSRVTRLGVRYTNQVLDSNLSPAKLLSFFEESVRGGLSIPLGSASIQHGLNDALFVVPPRSILGRWGLIPPGVVYDPTLAPVQHTSWFLDIDCFRESGLEMNTEALAEEARQLAEHEYSLFRWIVTDDFIEHFKASQDA